MAISTALSWYKGNTKRLTVNVKDVNTGNPVVLTGSSVTFTFTNAKTGVVAFTKTVGSGVTVATNSFTVTVSPADTTSLGKGDYFAQATVTLAGGDVATVLDIIVTLKEKYA